MPFPNSLLSQSIWRQVGLGLTTTILSLGVLAIISPTRAAKALGVIPVSLEGHDINRKSMIFLGIRDVAAALTLLWFHSERKTKEMGALMMAWVLVSVTDTWVASHGPNGFDSGIWTLCGASLAMAFIGAGLFQS
ncbi:hypothetical protein SVAN01_11846 [Stagonosporopsis vannaccii]|nr:hypothetical protein SVAN01_11846 [Stagonosporopsis vannaccii]